MLYAPIPSLLPGAGAWDTGNAERYPDNAHTRTFTARGEKGGSPAAFGAQIFIDEISVSLRGIEYVPFFVFFSREKERRRESKMERGERGDGRSREREKEREESVRKMWKRERRTNGGERERRFNE